MTGNPSPAALARLSTLRRMAEKVQHVHGLVERFASTRDPRQTEILVLPMKRAFGRLKLELMGAGFDSMSQLAGAMEIASGRGAQPQAKARILREGVGSLRSQIDLEQRKIVSEDRALQARAEANTAARAEEQTRSPGSP